MTDALDALTWLHGVLAALAGVIGVGLGVLAAMARHRRLLQTISAGCAEVEDEARAGVARVRDEGAAQVRRIKQEK